jgi:LytS/YehU family sensor histidine kinase
MITGTEFTRPLPAIFGIGFLLYLFSVAVHYVLLSFQSSRELERRAAHARLLAREAELRALKAQVNPHFLFNALNSISALTSCDSGRAREMCIRLSEFLRITLSLGDKASIAFGEELALARMYLEIEQVRFGDRLRVLQQVDGNCASFPIPPLVLQPLVENAVKHGVATMIEGAEIRLAACCGSGTLVVSVENVFDPEKPAPRRGGMGLANVRERLKARYDDRARLETSARGTTFLAQLVLPAEV